MVSVVAYLRQGGPPSRPSKKTADDQRAVISRWSEASGIAVSEFATDPPAPASTSFAARPGVKTFLPRLRRRDTVIAARFANFFETAADAHETLESAREAGYHFRAVDMQAGRLDLETMTPLLTALLAVSGSAYATTLRNRAVKRRELTRGRHTGGTRPMFGYDIVEGQLVENADQQAHIQHLSFLLSIRRMTYAKIAFESERLGFPLTAPGVHKILKRLAAQRRQATLADPP